MKIDDGFLIISDNPYYEEYKETIWTVSAIYRNVDEHPLYDTGVGGNLYEADDLPFLLYEYEVEEVMK